MKNTAIKICDAIIHPGEVASLALPLPQEYSCSPSYMPIKIIHGKKKGPCLVVLSALSGVELNGLEIANRLYEIVNPDEISGTLIIIPIVNIYALTYHPSTLPNGMNLSDCFPGDENGTFGERIAHLVTEVILKKADYCIELDTGEVNHNILPQVYCNFAHAEAKQLAKAFQTPVITNVDITDNTIRQTTEELKIPLLVYQAGEAARFNEDAIVLGVNGIKNVMRAINMLPKEATKKIDPIFSRDEAWIVSHKGGILYHELALGEIIKKNQIIGKIKDPFGSDEPESIKAPKEGIVVGINSAPLIHEGLPIFKIASFLDYNKAENAIEEWEQQLAHGNENSK